MDSGTSLHEERYNSEIEKILYDYFGERVNVYDRKVTVVVKNGHVDHGLILENSLVRLSLGKLCEEMERTKLHPYPLHVGKLCTDSDTWSQSQWENNNPH